MERAYLDQNVVGDIVNGKLKINSTEFQLLISETNFDELPTHDSDRYLNELEKYGVKLLIVGSNINTMFTDKAGIACGVTLKNLYYIYKEKQRENKSARSLNEIIVKLVGTKEVNNQDSILNQFNNIANQYNGTKHQFLFDTLKPMIEKLNSEIENGTTILEPAELTRKRINADKGKLNNIKGNKVIERIIKYLNDNNKDNFNIYSNLKKSKDSNYSKIILLNGFLNIVGYYPDVHLNVLDHVPNVQNDGEHMANAMFCNYLMTRDRKMAQRANAIYEFLELNTDVVLI